MIIRLIKAVLHTGVTHISTPDIVNFIQFKEAKATERMDGCADGLEIKGSGIIRYELLNKNGNAFEKEAFYIPGLPQNQGDTIPAHHSVQLCKNAYYGHVRIRLNNYVRFYQIIISNSC